VRVRLGDVDPTYLRHPEAREMVRFAERLYRETDGKIRPSRKYFEQLWPIVGRLLADGWNDKRQSRTGCDPLVDEDRPEGWLACATDVSALYTLWRGAGEGSGSAGFQPATPCAQGGNRGAERL